MKKSLITLLGLFFAFNLSFVQAQQERDKGKMEVVENPFWEKVEASVASFKNKDEEKEKSFVMDFENVDVPGSLEEFNYYWHNDPISQASTNTCWSFSTTSFYESEVYRLKGKKVKLSPMWTAYWEFVEKARGFVEHRGEWQFRDGSESNAVKRVWEKYGVVPAEAYTGLLPGQKYLNTMEMFDEMDDYLEFIKENNIWNEEEVTTTIKSIMNYYIGTPPESFVYDGKEYTPESFLSNYLELNLDDYVEVLSLMEKPYYAKVEFPVPDNWWHSDEYYNVPLDDFMSIIKKGIRNGYTIAIGGDVSEAGKNAALDVFVVPTFDIPSEYIDENARQFRFSNGSTGDDHGIHMVGYTEDKDSGKDWYLIKDSGSSSRNGRMEGYYIFSEDYVKLKMLGFTVHKDLMKDVMSKFK